MSQLETSCLKVTNWMPIAEITVRKAFEDISAGAVKFLRINEWGYPEQYDLAQWMALPVHDTDPVITTSRLHDIRRILVPRVCVTLHHKLDYARLAKERKPTAEALLRRYKGRDAVTGKKLTRDRVSREHVNPRSKGGGNGWDNLVPMDRDANSRRGNKTYAEAGLPEPKILGAPPPLLPINSIVNKHGYPEWDFFQIPRI